jgi:hypothetical protein
VGVGEALFCCQEQGGNVSEMEFKCGWRLGTVQGIYISGVIWAGNWADWLASNV